MNIYQKLIEVRKSCEYLKKDNKGYQFNFVSSSQTLGTLRGAMDAQGLLLVPNVLDYEVRDHKTSKGGHEYFTILKMKFTWVNSDNPEEIVECLWTGQGLDSGEKGVGKAMTYAEKYFLLKFFNIATDKDDPDSHQKKKKVDVRPLITKEIALEKIKNVENGIALKKVVALMKDDCKKYLSLDEHAEVGLAIEARAADFGAAS